MYGTPADPAVVRPGVGLTVAVRAGVYASLRGHAWSSGTEGDVLPVAANSSGQTRVDRVVLRLTRADWTVRAVVKTGTPGGGAPSLSQATGDTGTYEIPLAEVSVLSGANSVTVTRKELWVGTRIRPATSTTRNPLPIVGEQAYETDTGITRQWTGSSWRAIVEDSGEINCNFAVSSWQATVDSILEVKNGIATFRPGSFKRTAGTLSASADSKLPAVIPSRYIHPTRDQYILGYMTGAEVCRMQIYSKSSSETQRRGELWLIHHPGIAKNEYVLPSSGVSWVI
ncbi:hypothetical protein ACFVY9_03065 [Streptomyces sp. NPDC059544]|uniref:hypothetical protein n=1 Tax=Streptomyces sp. NPDC059544 TaxID=3346861 RepID=UPI0036BB93A1